MTTNTDLFPAELDEIAKRLGAVWAAELALKHAVRKARRADFSWADIAMPLGVTRQAAHERFRSVDD